MNATMRMSTTSSHENWETWMMEAKWPVTLGRLSPDGVAHAGHVHHLAHVVDADHVRAAQDAGGHRRRRAEQPLPRRSLEDPSDEALPRRAHEQRPLQRSELGEPADRLERVARVLGETEAGIDDRLLPAHTRLLRARQRLPQLRRHLG